MISPIPLRSIAYPINGILVALSSLAFGLFVLIRSENRSLGRAWFLFSCTTTFLGIGFVWSGFSHTIRQAYLSWCFLYLFSVVWIPPALLNFVHVFLGEKRHRSTRIHLFIGTLFACFVPTRLFFSHYHWFFNSFYFAVGGPLFYPFLVWWFGVVLYAHALLILAIPRSSKVQKNQIKYFLLATILGFSGGSYGYLANMGFDLYPWSDFTISLYPWVMAMAMVRHQLMDINVVVRKTFVYSFVSTVLAVVYVGTITVVAQIMGVRSGQAPILSSTLAAIVIALLFNPVRVRTQRWIDRRFPRERLDPELLQEAAGSFAHEMKRPLSKISLPAELALQDLEKVKQGETSWEDLLPSFEERLRFILNQSIDAGFLIEAIRELSASTAAPLIPTDLGAIIDRALMMEQDRIDKHTVVVRNQLQKGLPLVNARPKLLEIVFINLIKNAVESMSELPPQTKRILDIQGKRAGANLEVTVTDTGPGMTSDQKSKLFQPYQTTKGPHGTGIGLYLSNQILQLHNGMIHVASETGRGTSFSVSLPFINPSDQ